MRYFFKKRSTKKFLCLVNTLCLFLFAFSGCSVNEEADDAFNVVTVNFVQYDFARAVMGNDDSITMIMKPGAEIHSFEPSLSDIEAICNADVFIYNGGESDTWIEKIFDSIHTETIQKVALMDYATLIEDRHSGNSHSHSSNHKNHSHQSGEDTCDFKLGYDEHIWTSPQNAIKMIEAVMTALCSANPQMTDTYSENAEKYIKQISKIHHNLKEISENSESRFIAVGDRFPFLYLASEYELSYMAAFPGCSHENDASPSVIIDIIETMKKKNIDCVFYTETSNRSMAHTIQEETGAKELLLHSCQSISEEDFKSGKTYVDFMNENTKNLKEALN